MLQLWGQDILYGETAKFSIADQLQDGELVSVEKCKQILIESWMTMVSLGKWLFKSHPNKYPI